MSKLLAASSTDDSPEMLVRRMGRVVDQFDHQTQDSGNISWTVETDDGSYFVKTAGTLGPVPDGAPVPYFDHAGRVQLLRNAVELARCSHPCLARLRNVIETPLGPALVYDYAPGDLVGSEHRADPRSAYQRFAHLPAPQLLSHSTPSSTSTNSSPFAVGSPATSTPDVCWSISTRASSP